MGPLAAANGSRWSVGPAGAVLRAEPNEASTALVALDRGRRLVEFERRGAWLRVLVMGAVGLEGWVSRDALASAEVAAPGGADDGREVGTGSGAAEEPAPPPFVLAVTGSPALRFSVRCRQVGSSGRERSVTAEGSVPQTFRFAGRAVSCLVSKDDARGRLQVRLTHAGTTIAARETAAAYNYVRVRSDGPWGDAGSLRGAIPQVQFLPELRGGGRGETVPPLRGPIVPPLRQP